MQGDVFFAALAVALEPLPPEGLLAGALAVVVMEGVAGFNDMSRTAPPACAIPVKAGETGSLMKVTGLLHCCHNNVLWRCR